MIETQLVFKSEYRFDRTPGKTVLIPYLFTKEDNKLIISISANPTRNYRSSGKLEQIFFDIPNKPVGDSQITRFGYQQIELNQQGNFKLQFSPNYYLGKTTLLIKKFIPQTLTQSSEDMKENLIPKSQSVPLARGFVNQLLVPANPNRAYLEIRSGGSPVAIWADDFDDDDNLVTILAEISQGESYPLPVVDESIYQGAIYAQVTKNTNVDWTEYSYPEIP